MGRGRNDGVPSQGGSLRGRNGEETGGIGEERKRIRERTMYGIGNWDELIQEADSCSRIPLGAMLGTLHSNECLLVCLLILQCACTFAFLGENHCKEMACYADYNNAPK
eukprot:767813-Hanusia_phi.AAC.2